MVEPFELEKKQKQEVMNEKEHKAALGIVFQLVRYVPTGASLCIFGSFLLNQDWRAAVITFPIMIITVVWSAYSKGSLLQIQQKMDLSSKEGAESLIQVQKLDFLNFRANPNAKTVDLNGANLSGIDLSGADLRYANLNGANLSDANLSDANLTYADLRYANLSGANLSGANLKYANLSDANLYCTLLNGANLSDANLSRALLFFINLREVLNLEPLQLKGKPSPFLCNVALPSYSQQTKLNPNRSCDRFPQLLSDRYDISLEEAQLIVDEALQHHWG